MKPCPFCGSIANRSLRECGYTIRCNGCGAEMGEDRHEYPALESRESCWQRCLEKWNRRTPTQGELDA